MQINKKFPSPVTCRRRDDAGGINPYRIGNIINTTFKRADYVYYYSI
nr:MAG TPA: hypothetical protein [Caudoviricetes sp.]